MLKYPSLNTFNKNSNYLYSFMLDFQPYISHKSLTQGTIQKKKKKKKEGQLINLGNGEGRTPLILEDIQANISIIVYIWMENFGSERNLAASHTKHFSYAFWDMMKKKNKKEGYLGRFKRVIRRKMNGNLKNTTSIRAIIWTNYGCLPMEHVLSYWPYYYHQNSIHTFRFIQYQLGFVRNSMQNLSGFE